MSWNYRIIQSERPGGKIYTIHECFYDGDIVDQQEMSEDKRPNSICEDPHHPLALAPPELRRDLQRMLQALERDIVDREGFHVKVRYERKRSKSVAVDMNRLLKDLREEMREWKRNFLRANTRRVIFMQRVEELENELEALQAKKNTGKTPSGRNLDHHPPDVLDTPKRD